MTKLHFSVEDLKFYKKVQDIYTQEIARVIGSKEEYIHSKNFKMIEEELIRSTNFANILVNNIGDALLVTRQENEDIVLVFHPSKYSRVQKILENLPNLFSHFKKEGAEDKLLVGELKSFNLIITNHKVRTNFIAINTEDTLQSRVFGDNIEDRGIFIDVNDCIITEEDKYE